MRPPPQQSWVVPPARKVNVRLPGKGNSNCHGARPVHLIITMIKWFRTSRLSIKNSLSLLGALPLVEHQRKTNTVPHHAGPVECYSIHFGRRIKFTMP